MDAQGEEIVGDMTLFERTLRKRIHGELISEVECTSENERVDLLQKYFGITLRDVERKGILEKESQIS